MRYNFLHIRQELSQKFNRDYTISISSPLTVVFFTVVVLCLFIGCSTNYQGPLRFSGNSSEQRYLSEYNRDNIKTEYYPQKAEYVIDTLYMIDTIIEECPLDTPEETFQELIIDDPIVQEEYESCPLIFDKTTTGELLTKAEKRLKIYFIELLNGNIVLKYLFIKFLEILEVHLPNILDRLLEIFNLDELIDKQRYPEVYIYLSNYNLKNRIINTYLPIDIQKANYISGRTSEYISFSPSKSYSIPTKRTSRLKGLDTVH